MGKTTSLFIIPRGSTEWKGNEAGWITASGWAGAGKEIWGEAIVATTDGIFEPRESMLFPKKRSSGAGGIQDKGAGLKKIVRAIVPEIVITGIKDWHLKASKPKIWPIEAVTTLADKEVKLVWQRHDLFSGPGRRLADKFQAPLVTSVEALAVWEAEKWGVKRPLWGKWLEKNVEGKALRESDLICCVSHEIKEKVISMGIEEKKVIVTPNRVDSTLFHPEIEGTKVKKKYNLEGKKVLGWTGSFRGFHAIDNIVLAFEQVHRKHPETVLMLVGDGSEYEKIVSMVKELGLEDVVIMPGRKAFIEIPEFVANFHISLVSARSAEGFHYSPLKLREYLAAGKAVIAPEAGDLPEIFKEGQELLFYQAGDYKSLAGKMLQLLENPNKHAELTENAKSWFNREGSWTHELKRVCDILDITY